MEITISTDKVASGSKRLAKTALLVVFSAGWGFALAGVLLIPAEICSREFEFESTRLGDKESYARATADNSTAS